MLATLLKHLPPTGSRWTVTVADAGDGSGDVLVPLPEELLEQLGWQEGDTLSITREDSGDLALRRVE